MKIRQDSITWGEPGRIKALARKDMSPSPKIRVLLAALVGSSLGWAFLTYAEEDHPFLIAIVVLFFLLPSFAIWVDLYAGRGIELTHDRIIMFSLGSRMPRSIMFSDLVRCETRTISAQNYQIPVFVFESSDGKTATVELPQDSDIELIATFLREKNVLVNPAA